MKRRTFQEYLKTRLNENEIAQIKKQALREKKALKKLQSKLFSPVRTAVSDEALAK
jgi:hypothetical protein